MVRLCTYDGTLWKNLWWILLVKLLIIFFFFRYTRLVLAYKVNHTCCFFKQRRNVEVWSRNKIGYWSYFANIRKAGKTNPFFFDKLIKARFELIVGNCTPGWNFGLPKIGCLRIHNIRLLLRNTIHRYRLQFKTSQNRVLTLKLWLFDKLCQVKLLTAYICWDTC